MTRRLPRPLSRLLPALAAVGLAAAAAVAVSPAADASGAPAAAGPGSLSLAWTLLPTGSAAQFRGLSAVSDKVAWVSGTQGTVLRTVDGGKHWLDVSPSLSSANAAFQFRDVEAFSATSAVILSADTGTAARILVTDDGGATWQVAFVNHEPTAFYDCMAFTSPKRGLAVSDPVNGKFRLVETIDGGHSWTLVPSRDMPPALPGEFGFAASGTCLTAGQGQHVYLASGGVDPGRVFRSSDGGRQWQVSDTTVAGGASAGVFSVRFRDAMRGIAVGGDYTDPTGSAATASWSSDGGVTWHPATTMPGGYRSGSSWAPGLPAVALAVGPSGSDVTTDAGRTWQTFDTGDFDNVQCTAGLVCWASGPEGRVARLTLTSAG